MKRRERFDEIGAVDVVAYLLAVVAVHCVVLADGGAVHQDRRGTRASARRHDSDR
jgi:hypothetical protein